MKNKFLLLLLLVFSTNIAFANSVEIAKVTAHYTHPVHNTVEDSGNNSEIGQGMSESVLGPQALIEVDEKNQIYATFRFNMANEISSFKISVQKDGDTNFKKVSHQKMQSSEKTVDLRVPIDSKNSIIRVEAFVNAMGRSVIFYGRLGSRVEGNTDFIISVGNNSENNFTKDSNNILEDNNQNVDEINSKVENATSEINNLKKTDEADIESTENKTKSESEIKKGFNLKDEDFDNIGLIMRDDERLEKSNALGNQDFSAEHPIVEEIETDYFTRMAIYSFFNVFATISVLLFLIGVGMVVFFYKLRKKNDIEEEKLYGFKK